MTSWELIFCEFLLQYSLFWPKMYFRAHVGNAHIHYHLMVIVEISPMLLLFI